LLDAPRSPSWLATARRKSGSRQILTTLAADRDGERRVAARRRTQVVLALLQREGGTTRERRAVDQSC
jgi:hypothetical protein